MANLVKTVIRFKVKSTLLIWFFWNVFL